MANSDPPPTPTAKRPAPPPSAPPQPLYSTIGNDAQVFRLQRVNEVANELRAAIEKSKATAGKYKKTVVSIQNKSIVAVSLGAVLGASAAASSMTSIGIVTRIPLATVAALLGVTSVATGAIQARLSRKL